MNITATQLKQNLGHYLTLARDEDIFITKNGRIIARLSNPVAHELNELDSLVGIIPESPTLEEALDSRATQL